MIPNNFKTSLLIPSQLPAFIREDPNYATFVAFIQAYYEWLEQENNITDRSKNILNYIDVDNTTDEFIQYFLNDFLPYFPNDLLADQKKLLKVAKELYSAKGTPASYNFLFRVLYNTDCNLYNTGDTTFKTSSGVWFIPTAVRLNTIDPTLETIKGLSLLGLKSNAFANIEVATIQGNKTSVYISKLTRAFISGEFVQLVYNDLTPAYFLNGQIVPAGTVGATTLEYEIIGSVLNVTINPNARGLYYSPGDPVVFYGGSRAGISNTGASAEVFSVSTGSVASLYLTNGGYGYRDLGNTTVTITGNGTGAAAVISAYDTANSFPVNFVDVDVLGPFMNSNVTIANTNTGWANATSNILNTTMINAFSFLSFNVSPLLAVLLTSPGTGYPSVPSISVNSSYKDTTNTSHDISTLGILAPLQIVNPGLGYTTNDKIIISGGSGIGAYANIATVNANGAITSVKYVYPPTGPGPYGGIGYQGGLPVVTISTANGTNASIVATGTIGTGAQFVLTSSQLGAIQSISVLDGGIDYITSPNVSLQIFDIEVTNLLSSDLPQSGESVYQQQANTKTFTGYIDSVTEISSNNINQLSSIWKLRCYNFNTYPNTSLPLIIDTSNISMNIVPNTLTTYGDGQAEATVQFSSGTYTEPGRYLTISGQPSSYSIIQSEMNNGFTYEIYVEKEIARYRDALLNILHPAGLNFFGVNIIPDYLHEFNYNVSGEEQIKHTLQYVTGSANAMATISLVSGWSSNTITISNNTSNLANVMSVGNYFSLWDSDADMGIYSMITSISGNTITVQDSIPLLMTNVAYAYAQSNSIHITSFTNTLDYLYGPGNSDDDGPDLDDAAIKGDLVTINNTIQTVTSVDYTNNIIYVANTIGTIGNANNPVLITTQRHFNTANAYYYTFI
jgi:hypothetical protein